MASRNILGFRGLAPAGSTGNNTHNGVEYSPGGSDLLSQVAFQFVIEAVGATPTVTFKFQGSLDNSNWVDIICIPSDSDTAAVSQTKTATGSTVVHIAQAHSRAYRYIRCVTSANTNVTYRAEAYAWN